MEFEITLERVPSMILDEDERLIAELEKTAQTDAINKSGRIPSLTEVLWKMNEEEMLGIKE